MGFFLFVLVPAGWWLTGWLFALAVRRTVGLAAGGELGWRLAPWGLAALSLACMVAGLSGAAGSGVRLFGSAWLVELACLPVYAVPALAAYLVVAVVVRDLTRRPG